MIDELLTGSGVAAPRPEPEERLLDLLNGGDLETIVLHVVKDDPFASISEIKHRIRTSSPHSDAGWWRIFGILRQHGLMSRRARFRFARGRR